MGSLVKAYGQIRQGRAAKKSAYAEARLMEQDAIAAEADAGAEEGVYRREGRYLQSRAQAVAAGSGASVRDPTVLNLMAGIEAESEYSALSALYSGKSEATRLRLGARARRSEGRAARTGGYLSAAATIFDDAQKAASGG